MQKNCLSAKQAQGSSNFKSVTGSKITVSMPRFQGKHVVDIAAKLKAN
jgi:hypothetical protein